MWKNILLRWTIGDHLTTLERDVTAIRQDLGDMKKKQSTWMKKIYQYNLSPRFRKAAEGSSYLKLATTIILFVLFPLVYDWWCDIVVDGIWEAIMFVMDLSLLDFLVYGWFIDD